MDDRKEKEKVKDELHGGVAVAELEKCSIMITSLPYGSRISGGDFNRGDVGYGDR